MGDTPVYRNGLYTIFQGWVILQYKGMCDTQFFKDGRYFRIKEWAILNCAGVGDTVRRLRFICEEKEMLIASMLNCIKMNDMVLINL